MSAKPAGRRGRRKRGGHDEEHVNHERWLVTYSDMMTLLMVLFIIMFAMSQVDAVKFAQLKAGLAVGFGAEHIAFNGQGNQVHDENNADSNFDMASNVGPGNGEGQVQAQDEARDEELKEAVRQADLVKASTRQQHAQGEVKNLEEIKQKILGALDAKGLAGSVRFSIDERGLIVTIVTSSVIFAGDRAELLDAGRQVLDAVGPALVALPNHVQVDGHTNQLPIPTVNYPSGWELSTARASSVVRYLNERHGVPETRLSAAGYADTRPLYPASDARAVTLNRRVEVVVMSTLSAEERALLPSAAAGRAE